MSAKITTAQLLARVEALEAALAEQKRLLEQQAPRSAVKTLPTRPRMNHTPRLQAAVALGKQLGRTFTAAELDTYIASL